MLADPGRSGDGSLTRQRLLIALAATALAPTALASSQQAQARIQRGVDRSGFLASFWTPCRKTAGITAFSAAVHLVLASMTTEERWPGDMSDSNAD
jgi:hypothetical protein